MWRMLMMIAMLILPRLVWAQAERLGAVAGTYAACEEALGPVKKRAQEAADNPKAPLEWKKYLEHRVAVELDKCVQIADSPASAVLEAITRYERLEIFDRALVIAFSAMERIGRLPDFALSVGRIYFKKSEQEKGLPFLKEVIAARRTDAQANQLLANYFYSNGKYEDAIPHLRIVAKDHAEEFDANAALGDACLRTKDLECAGEFLGRASRLKPNDELLAVKVGDLEYQNKRYGPSLEAYARATDANPNRLDARLGWMRTAEAAGQLESAAAAIEKAMDVFPDDPVPFVETSRLKRKLHRPDPTLLQTFVADPKAEVPVHAEHTLALLHLGQVDRAKQHLSGLQQSLAADDRMVAIAGDVFLAQGNLHKALSTYRKARGLRPSAPAYVVREARVLRKLDQLAEAAQVLKPKLQESMIQDEYVATLLDISRTQALENAYDQAEKTLVQALVENPDDRDVRVAKIVVQAKRGKFAVAGAELKKLATGPDTMAAEAWIEYQQQHYQPAIALAGAAQAAMPQNAWYILEAAALSKAKQHMDAWLLLRDKNPTSHNEAHFEWQGHALSRAANNMVRSGALQKAKELVLSDSSKLLPKSFAVWLNRVPLLHEAHTGSLVEKSTTFQTYATSIAKENKELIDHALLSLGFLSEGVPTKATKQLKLLQHALAQPLKQRALLDTMADQFSKGKLVAAKRIADTLQKPKRLSLEAQCNAITVRHASDPRSLLKHVEPFVNQQHPEALFNQALAMDLTSKKGNKSIDPLKKLLRTKASKALLTKAQALLALKKQLY